MSMEKCVNACRRLECVKKTGCRISCLADDDDDDDEGLGWCSKIHCDTLRQKCNQCRSVRCKGLRSLCTKAVLVIVNLSFMFCGLGFIAGGIWLHIYRESLLVSFVLRDNPSHPVLIFDRIPFCLIGIGALLVILSFLGCCGACAESVCFLGFYTFFLLLIIALEITAAIMLCDFKEQFYQELLMSMLYEVLHEYNKTAKPLNQSATAPYTITKAWNDIQYQFNCCGANGPQDFRSSSWFNNSPVTEGILVPASCCTRREGPIELLWPTKEMTDSYCQVHAILFPDNLNESAYLNTQGCHSVFVGRAEDYQQLAIMVMFLILLIQVMNMLCSCFLIRNVRKKQLDYWWCEDEECD